MKCSVKGPGFSEEICYVVSVRYPYDVDQPLADTVLDEVDSNAYVSSLCSRENHACMQRYGTVVVT